LSVVHADYLLAADGTRSPVRRQLGISATGCVSNLGDGDAVQINNPDLDGIFVVAQHAEPGPLPESPERELRQVLCRMLSRH
jgi:2-polyprenyl-6-methoxyphenol hydroxylase-like FAD-dependent oxidoreductase